MNFQFLKKTSTSIVSYLIAFFPFLFSAFTCSICIQLSICCIPFSPTHFESICSNIILSFRISIHSSKSTHKHYPLVMECNAMYIRSEDEL